MGRFIDKLINKNTVLDSKNRDRSTVFKDTKSSDENTKRVFYPTPYDFCVPDVVKVSGELPDTLPENVSAFASPTQPVDTAKVSGELPDTLPEPAEPQTPAAVCHALLEHPPTREQAVERLVKTFRAEIHNAQRQRWLTTTLSGKLIADAPEAYLLAEAVGLTAWAQDREEHGVFNQGAYAWIAAAWQVVERRAHRLKAA